MPVILAGNDQQKKKYLGRMTEQPMMCVSMFCGLCSACPVNGPGLRCSVCLCLLDHTPCRQKSEDTYVCGRSRGALVIPCVFPQGSFHLFRDSKMVLCFVLQLVVQIFSPALGGTWRDLPSHLCPVTLILLLSVFRVSCV